MKRGTSVRFKLRCQSQQKYHSEVVSHPWMGVQCVHATPTIVGFHHGRKYATPQTPLLRKMPQQTRTGATNTIFSQGHLRKGTIGYRGRPPIFSSVRLTPCWVQALQWVWIIVMISTSHQSHHISKTQFQGIITKDMF